jgi:antitoxin (DNA-binding transcriptional repressor) of toxin-antitoxin stability system
VRAIKWFLAQRLVGSCLGTVKTATVQQVPEQWPDILQWVAAGEEVQMTDRDKVVAKLVPAAASQPQPDFLIRAKAVWGENPPGKSLSEIVFEARGGER